MTYVPLMDRPPATTACAHGMPAIRPLSASACVRTLAYACPATLSHTDWDGRHDALSLMLVGQGAFTYRADGADALVEPGMVVMALPGEAYRCAHPHGLGDESLVIQLAPDTVPADWLPDRSRSARRVLPASPALAGHLWRAAKMPDPLARDEAGISALALAATLAETPVGAAPLHLTDERDRCHAAAAFIVRHADDPLDLAAIAGHMAMGPFALIRAFRRHLSLSPYQYLIKTRLRLAVEYLLTSDLSVTEIAYTVGFSDLSNFVRTFHRQVGYPPGALRRR